MNKQITFLLLWGMVFVLIVTLLGFALISFEYEDIPSIERIVITGIKGYLLPELFLAGFQLAVIAIILVFEYLRSHIGEKRFSEERINVCDRFSLVRFFTTAPLEPSFVFFAPGKQ